MKTLILILTASLILSSCTQNNENEQSKSQLLTSNDCDCICQLIAKNQARKQRLITRGGIRIMELKINRY